MTDLAAPPPAPKRSNPLKWLLLACGSCLVLACLCGSGFAFMIRQTTQPAVDAFQRHVETVAAGRLEEAYQETSSGFRADTSPEQFQRFVEESQTLYSGKSFSFWNREVKTELGSAPTALIRGTVEGPGGAVQVQVRLVKEEGAWRVHTIEPPGAQ